MGHSNTDDSHFNYERQISMKHYKLTEAEQNRHPRVSVFYSSAKFMKDNGYWGRKDKCVRCGDYIYNLSRFNYEECYEKVST